MKYIYYGRELYHHGILGMKWGKRNGPPYPLGASDHSASEKKAGWRKSLETEDKSAAKNNSGKASEATAKKTVSKRQQAKSDRYIQRNKELFSEARLKKETDFSKKYLDNISKPEARKKYFSDWDDDAYAREIKLSRNDYIKNVADSNVVKKTLLTPISSIDTSSLSYKQVKQKVNQYLSDYANASLAEEERLMKVIK